MEFTFCTLTFNQERFVAMQLESIKYLINRYGTGIKFHYILSDDCSSDNTVFIVKKWISKNNTLFSDVKIIETEVNQGIVANFIRAYNAIETNEFKILAGDDLYTYNNLFSVFDGSDFYISPTLRFIDNDVTQHFYNDFFKYILAFESKSNELQRFINRQYKCSTGIDAAGMFFPQKTIRKDISCILGNYKWIDDTPLISYIMSLPNIKISILTKPYVFYRVSDGITRKKDLKLYNEYCEERKRVNNTIHIHRKNLPNIINPYQYIRFMDIVLSQLKGLIYNNYYAREKRIKNDYKRDIKRGNVFLKYITNESNKFYSEVGIEF